MTTATAPTPEAAATAQPIEDRSLYLRRGRTGILLVHGLGGTPVEMRTVALGLARQGYTVYCPQLAGHCGSADQLRATGWKDWLASVEAAHDRLLDDCDTVIVGGLSMGAVLALHLAAIRPDTVAGVAMFAPTLWLNGWGVPWYARLFRLCRHKIVADRFDFRETEPFGIKDPRIRQLIANALASGDSSQAGQYSTPGSTMLELRWLSNKVRSQLSSIKQPVLILHPREDDRADLSNAFYLQRHLGGSVETVVLDDSYHIVTIDRQRHVVIERTGDFAGRIAARIAQRQPRPAPATVVARAA